MKKPSIRQIEYFVAISRFESFRRAAYELGISQPTITAQIAQAEKILGVRLFERGRGGATMTPAGRQLLPIARRALEEVDNLVASAGAASRGAATYRLGVKATLGPYILPRILPAMHSLHRDLKLYVREEPPALLETKLENGDLDLVLTAFPTNSSEMEMQRVRTTDYTGRPPFRRVWEELPVIDAASLEPGIEQSAIQAAKPKPFHKKRHR